MDHFFRKIPGWFTFPELYRSAVKKFDNALFVEVGSWLGQSCAFMGVEIINSGKNIKMDCIDIWEPSEDYKLPANVTDLQEVFLENIKPVNSVVRSIKKSSIEAAKDYEDESIDFIFIDGSHHFEDVLKDLIAWWPKLKTGGVFAGHDYSNSVDVKHAVDAWLIMNNLTLVYDSEQCWGLSKK
jgi:predicted O-methyltransferase YrrM